MVAFIFPPLRHTMLRRSLKLHTNSHSLPTDFSPRLSACRTHHAIAPVKTLQNKRSINSSRIAKSR